MPSRFLSTVAALIALLTLGASPSIAGDAQTKWGTPEIKVFPPEAISAAMRFDKKTFQDLYPGIDVTYTGITDEGFYIRYEHEFMVFFFGPIATVQEAVKHRGDMDYLRSQLLLKQPELENSTVHLIRVGHQRHGSGTDIEVIKAAPAR